MPRRSQKNPNGSTGPRSDDGKKISSQNSTKHGCCSHQLLLPGEDPAELDEITRGWKAQFEPADFQEDTLVGILIENDVLYRRARRRLFQAENDAVAASGPDPVQWSPEQRHHVDLMQRYKITAERAFYRAWKALQELRKDIMKENIRLLKSLEREASLQEKIDKLEARVNPPGNPSEAAQTPAQRLFRGQLHPKKQRKSTILEQWVEVEVDSGTGKTITTLYPSNEELIKKGQAMLPPPDYIYRRFCFPGGVPPEYFWTTNDPIQRQFGGAGIQRMSVDTWLELIEREKAAGTGHLSPIGNLPRPKDRGGCDCEVCSHNRDVLEAAGID